jgi:thiol-disulfide isomerase/thioredoxin
LVVLAGVPVRAGTTNGSIPVLKAGNEIYTNVVVLAVNATHVSFTHSRGMASLKLRDLAPELQKRFQFNEVKATEIEAKQHEANAEFRKTAIALATAQANSATNKPSIADVPEPAVDENGDIFLPVIYARSFRGQTPPQIIVDQWISSSPPTVEGKFVLVDFWASWAEPCKRSIPHLNALSAKFKDQLVVIGLSDESADDIRKMKSPVMDYFVGTDLQARTRAAVEVRGLPHSLLMDPTGIVRYEGVSDYLTEQCLERLIQKYSK